MKKYMYVLLVLALFALQGCGGVKPAVDTPPPPRTPAIIPPVSSNGPYDPSLQGSALNRPSTSTATGSGSGAPANCAASDADAAAYGVELINLVNAERAKVGLNPVTSQSQLTQAAQRHAFDMGCNFLSSHTGSDGSTPFSRMVDAGYVFHDAGEDVGVGYYSPADVINAWMNSPAHRAEILKANYTDAGVGYVYNPDDATAYWFFYWVLDFGQP